jgi:hypothetical protein
MTPLRQFKGIPRDIVRKAESKQFVRFRSFRMYNSVSLTSTAVVSLL